MMRSYELKQESYIVHERQSWVHPSYEEYHDISSHKMLHKPSFHYPNSSSHGHHSRSWCGTHHLNGDNFIAKRNENQTTRMNHGHRVEDGMAAFGAFHWDETSTHNLNNNNSNFIVKKNNEHHQALGAKSIPGPPLGSVNPPNRHQYHHHHTMYEGAANPNERQYFQNEGSMEQFKSTMANNNNNKWTLKKFEEYDYDAGLKEELESLIKGLRGSGLHGREVVQKIELIAYERKSTSFGGVGGLRLFQKY